MEALYITGHSLGAAMAALMAVLLAAETDPLRRDIAATLRTVHTFGQPMVGTPEFAAAADQVPWPADGSPLGEHVIRWAHHHDAVTWFPPRSAGPFAHFGHERRFRPGHGWVPQVPPTGQAWNLLSLALSPLAILTDAFEATRGLWWGPSLDDHLPERYLARLAPEGVTSEYGD